MVHWRVKTVKGHFLFCQHAKKGICKADLWYTGSGLIGHHVHIYGANLLLRPAEVRTVHPTESREKEKTFLVTMRLFILSIMWKGWRKVIDRERRRGRGGCGSPQVSRLERFLDLKMKWEETQLGRQCNILFPSGNLKLNWRKNNVPLINFAFLSWVLFEFCCHLHKRAPEYCMKKWW